MYFFTFILFRVDIPVSSEDPDQTPRSAASDHGLHVCLCPKNGTLGLYGLN